MKKTLALVAGALVVGLAAFIGTRPDDFRIERSARVEAPPEVAYALLEDFHQWPRWSPYEGLDADLQRTYAGPASGVGASYAWKGEKAGAGRMTIEEAVPGQRLRIKLEFTEPIAATNETVFTVTADGAGSRVSWAMAGKNSLLAKAMCLVVDMDRMLGADFEKGLATLAEVAKQEAQKAPAAPAEGTAAAPVP
jgi:uncharacterized protein YndB with AHSA1/START domain